MVPTQYLSFASLAGGSARITIDTSQQVIRAYGLARRGTSVFRGTAALVASEISETVALCGPMDATMASKLSEERREVTVKIYWQDESRLNEAEGLETDTLGHPRNFAHDLSGYSTGFIRKKLGLGPPEGRRPARVLRLAVFPRTRPITAVFGDAFLKAWLACVRGACCFGLV